MGMRSTFAAIISFWIVFLSIWVCTTKYTFDSALAILVQKDELDSFFYALSLGKENTNPFLYIREKFFLWNKVLKC